MGLRFFYIKVKPRPEINRERGGNMKACGSKPKVCFTY